MDKIEEITEAVKEFFERETKELSKEEYQEVMRERMLQNERIKSQSFRTGRHRCSSHRAEQNTIFKEIYIQKPKETI